MFRSVGWRWAAELEVWSCQKGKSHQDEESNVRTVRTSSTAFSDDLNWWLQGSTLPPLAFVGIPQFGPSGFRFSGWRICAMTTVDGQTDRRGRSLYLHCQLSGRSSRDESLGFLWRRFYFAINHYLVHLFVHCLFDFGLIFSQNCHLVEDGLL